MKDLQTSQSDLNLCITSEDSAIANDNIKKIFILNVIGFDIVELTKI